MSANKVVYAVWAPMEGDGPDDATWWYFRTYKLADDFANDGWGADYGITNFSEAGPFTVQEMNVSNERYATMAFTSKTKDGRWETKRGRR